MMLCPLFFMSLCEFWILFVPSQIPTPPPPLSHQCFYAFYGLRIVQLGCFKVLGMAWVMKMFFIVLILHSSIVHSPVKNGSNPEGKKKTYYKGEDARNNKVFEALDTAIRQELGRLFRQHSFQIKSSTTQAIDISLDGKGMLVSYIVLFFLVFRRNLLQSIIIVNEVPFSVLASWQELQTFLR